MNAEKTRRETSTGDLWSAAAWGNRRGIRRAVLNGADINVRDTTETTPLMLAAARNVLSPELFNFFIQLGADVNAYNSFGLNVLSSCQNLTPELLEAFLAAGLKIFDRDPRFHRTPIMAMARKGSLTPETLHFFAELGEDMGARDRDGNTSLILAARNGNLDTELARAFLELGADVNVKNDNGDTALMYIVKSRYTDDELERLLSLFVSHGADINVRNNVGQTPLILASRSRMSLHRMELYVRYGADLNIQDVFGITAPMNYALHGEYGYPGEVTQRFVSWGADISTQNHYGNTAMSIGIMGGVNYSHGIMSFIDFLHSGYPVQNMYADWTPESFAMRIQKNKFMSKTHRASCAILASASMYPAGEAPCYLEGDGYLKSLISGKESRGLAALLPFLFPGFPFLSNVFRTLTADKKKILPVSMEYVDFLVPLLLDCFTSDTNAVVEFIAKRIGKQLGTWTEKGVKGTDELVAKLVPYFQKEASVEKVEIGQLMDF